MRKLNIPRLEAFLFHNAEYIFDEAAVRALYCACQEGMAEKIGVSIYTPQEAMKALEYGEIEVIQIPYNVFDQRLDKCGFFEKAKKKGVEVYARSSMLQERLLMDLEGLPERMCFAKTYLRRLCPYMRRVWSASLKSSSMLCGKAWWGPCKKNLRMWWKKSWLIRPFGIVKLTIKGNAKKEALL